MFTLPASTQQEDLPIEGVQLNAGFIILSIFLLPTSYSIAEAEYN